MSMLTNYKHWLIDFNLFISTRTYKSEHWRRRPSLYNCQMMRSLIKSRVLQAFRVTL